MAEWREKLSLRGREAASYLRVFCKWAVVAAGSGLLCGAAGAAFYHCVQWATDTRHAHPWLLYLLPVAGLVITLLYHAAEIRQDEGTNLVIAGIHSGKRPPLRLAALIFAGTFFTHLCGGSSGREGAALQIGGALGNSLAARLRLSEKDRITLMLCGMSGLFSAIFGTPLTATLFSLEVISVGIFHYSALLPCLFSAITAYQVAGALRVCPESFRITVTKTLTAPQIWRVILLAFLCALVGILFCKVMHTVSHLYQTCLPNAYLRVFVGGCLVVGLSLLTGTRDYNGAGMDVVARALEGQAAPWAFLVKIVLTALTLGAGFKGGEIVPAFFVGATFGCAFGNLFHLDAGFAAAIGLIAVFCAMVNCPIASMVLSIELFGADNLLLFALAAAVSYLMSGPYSLYSSQRLTYSKLEPTFVNESGR